MATIEINTQSAGYQNRLTQLTDIIQFYKPIIKEYMRRNEDERKAWRQRDPLLKALVSIWYYIQNHAEL